MKVTSSISFRAVRAAAINHIRWYNLHYITIQITITWPGLAYDSERPREKIFDERKKKKDVCFGDPLPSRDTMTFLTSYNT